jgi:hypothetical protein
LPNNLGDLGDVYSFLKGGERGSGRIVEMRRGGVGEFYYFLEDSFAYKKQDY